MPSSGVQMVIHVAGIVLDADRLPEEVPIVGATVVIEGLRGWLADDASVRAQTDTEGRFDLQIPMERAMHPYWWGEIRVEAPGYNSLSARVLCCSDDPSMKDCTDEMRCSPGRTGFRKVGLSRHPPRVVIHVTGMVFDADQLPASVPIAGATVIAENLQGVPVDGASVSTQSDVEGRFDLWLPIEVEGYPYWLGEIRVEASGYSPGYIKCSNWMGAPCKIGLSRHGPTPTPLPDIP